MEPEANHPKPIDIFIACGLAPQTASLYAANAGRMIRRYFEGDGLPTPDDLLTFDSLMAKSRRGQFRSGWRAFTRWCRDNGMRIPNDIPTRRSANINRAVVDAAALISVTIPQRVAVKLRWGDVHIGEGVVDIVSSTHRTRVYGEKAISTLRSLALWGHNTVTPEPGMLLFPSVQGGDRPLTVGELRMRSASIPEVSASSVGDVFRALVDSPLVQERIAREIASGKDMDWFVHFMVNGTVDEDSRPVAAPIPVKVALPPPGKEQDDQAPTPSGPSAFRVPRFQGIKR